MATTHIKTMKDAFWALSLLILTSCSQLPQGTAPMKKMIMEGENKMENDVSVKETSMIKGREQFVKVHQYPQLVKGGYLLMSGTVIVPVGREEMTIDQIVESVKETK